MGYYCFGKYKGFGSIYDFISAQDGVETKVKSNDYPLNFNTHAS
jgi:hypothetical protein